MTVQEEPLEDPNLKEGQVPAVRFGWMVRNQLTGFSLFPSGVRVLAGAIGRA